MVESMSGRGQTPFSDYDAFRNRHIPFLFLSSGRTPHYTALTGQKGIAALLIAKGADVKAEGLDPFTRQPGITPLHLANSPALLEFMQSKATK